MTNARQAGAYPSLIPGNQQGARDESKPWDVIELDDEARMAAGGIGPSTSKGSRILKLPKVILRHDWWVRYHELTHVERPTWEQSKNGLRNAMRQMLEEVALDGQCLLRDGIDLRQARDQFDWDKYERPADVYRAAGTYFQVYTSAQITQSESLKKLWGELEDQIARQDPNDHRGKDLLETLKMAAEAVFNDYSSGNCEDWADIVTAKLLGVPKEEIPNAPEPPSGATASINSSTSSNGQSGSSSSSAGPAGQAGADDSDELSTGAGSGSPNPGDDEMDDSDGTCPACGGEGVDEDGDECAGCGGTGTAPGSSGEDPGEDGDDDQPSGTPGSDPGDSEAGDEDQEDSDTGAGHSEWDTPPLPLDKSRQNDPMEFKFDPLGKTEMDPHKTPPETKQDLRERKKISTEQLQEEIDRERVNRKQGESSQSEELTARTPFGAVDVHRHTLSRGVSMSVALGWRSSESGATVRYPSQLYSNNGRVFAKRAPGGSIILDGSGSMSWHTQHIMEAQKQMPNLYVAVYSYHGSNGYWMASKGRVATDTFIARYCVLAAKGKLDPDGIASRDAEPEHTGGNSGADPAALWYATKYGPKPIVWVSDGMVSFGESQEFWKQCDALMRQHKIVRVLTIEDAIDYLLGKAVPGWHQCATVDTRWVRLGQAMLQTRMAPEKTEREAERWSRLRANSRRK